MLSIEIINKILVYISELNNDIIITQYNPITNKEYYKINYNSGFLWKIKSGNSFNFQSSERQRSILAGILRFSCKNKNQNEGKIKKLIIKRYYA